MLTFIASSKPPKMNEINGDLRGTSFSHWSNHHAHWTCPPLAVTKNIQPFLEKWVNISSANSKTSQVNNSNMKNESILRVLFALLYTNFLHVTVYKYCLYHHLWVMFIWYYSQICWGMRNALSLKLISTLLERFFDAIRT